MSTLKKNEKLLEVCLPEFQLNYWEKEYEEFKKIVINYMPNHNEISSFIWKVCDDVLRGLFNQHEYGDVILSFVIFRRLDCVLEGKKIAIIDVYKEVQKQV